MNDCHLCTLDQRDLPECLTMVLNTAGLEDVILTTYSQHTTLDHVLNLEGRGFRFDGENLHSRSYRHVPTFINTWHYI